MLSRYKFLAIGAAFLTLAACKDEENRQETAASSSAPVVQAIKAVPHEIPLSFEYAARVQGSKETEVRARVGGILLKRNYVEGSKVREGDVLFQIDPEPFEVELLQAKAELSQNEANLKAAETQSGVTFTDAMGYPVTVQSWNRVVSLYGSFAEAWTLAGGTLTATTEDAIKERGLDLGTDIAVIGTNQDPNTEEILAQNPDFVILNAEVSEQTALHEFLQEAGVPHAYFKTNTFDEYLAMLRTFCDMTGREDLYEQNGLAVQQQISDVLELVQNAKLPAPNVLLLRAYSSGCKAKGSDNMTGAMLKDLGAINIADADDSLLENLSMENIIADDPEDIFVVTMGASQQKALDWLAENLQANPAWSGLSAVQSGHYYLLDKALFHYKPNARWGESYRTLAALLYPQLADQLEALA